MTDREKLFTLFQDCNNPSWKWFPNNAEMMKLIEYLIAHGVTVREWISVKDRLPKKDDDVLCSRGNHIGAMMDVYTYKGNNKWEDSYGYVDSADGEGITHWMPIPQPPKGE